MATGTGYIYKTLPNDLRIKTKTQVFGRIIGDTNTSLRLLGDTTNVTMGRTIEEGEVYSNETPDKDLALTDVTKNDISFTLELRQMTEFAKRIMFQSDQIKTNQVAATDQTIIFQDQSVGDLLPLGYMSVENVVVKVGSDVLVRGTHYSLDEEAGRIQIDALPGNATTADIDVTFDAPATTITSYGLASRTDIRVELFMRQNNKWGPSFEYSVWNCQARPDGDLQIGQDGDDFGSATIICRAYADSTRPAAFRLGQVRQIPKKLAA